MPCDCCQAARESPDHRMHCPSCLWCGARLIRNLGRLALSADQIRARRQAVLSDWMDHGHAEADLRAWAKRADCYAPGPECPSESDGPRPTKRR